MNIERPIHELVDAVTVRGGRETLADLMVDASGRPMMLAAAPPRSRHYVSVGDEERIGVARVERSAVQLLQRLFLVEDDRSARELTGLLRRIVVCPDCLVFQLDRRTCLSIWRGQGRLPSRIAKADLLRAIASWLPEGYEVADVGWVLCLTSPRRTRPRRGRIRAVED